MGLYGVDRGGDGVGLHGETMEVTVWNISGRLTGKGQWNIWRLHMGLMMVETAPGLLDVTCNLPHPAFPITSRCVFAACQLLLAVLNIQPSTFRVKLEAL